MKHFFLFFISKTFWLNILAIIGVSVALLIGTLHWLDIYTEHGKAETVPDIVGLTIDEAVAQLRQNGLRYDIVDSVYHAQSKPGVIIDQLPKAESKVKNNRIVFLTISAKSPLSIVVPDVKDMSQRQAVAILKGSGFQIGEIKYVPSEYRNLVIDILHHKRSIRTGEKLPIETTIDLIVGEGRSSEMIPMPSFHGLSLEEASHKAVIEGLVIGGVFYDKTPGSDEEKTQYVVYQQTPEYRTMLPKGKAIDLYLTKDKEQVVDPKATEEPAEKKRPVEIDNKDESWF